MAQVEGLKVSGEIIKGLENKRFVIVSNPQYKEIPDADDNTKTKRRLILSVSLLENNIVMDYCPNNSSIKAMTKLYGLEMDNWVGKIFEWDIIDQKFMGMQKPVLYVKEEKIE